MGVGIGSASGRSSIPGYQHQVSRAHASLKTEQASLKTEQASLAAEQGQVQSAQMSTESRYQGALADGCEWTAAGSGAG